MEITHTHTERNKEKEQKMESTTGRNTIDRIIATHRKNKDIV